MCDVVVAADIALECHLGQICWWWLLVYEEIANQSLVNRFDSAHGKPLTWRMFKNPRLYHVSYIDT